MHLAEEKAGQKLTDSSALEAWCGEGHGISAGAGSQVPGQGLAAAALGEQKPPGPQGPSFPSPLPGSVAKLRVGRGCGLTPLFCLCPRFPRAWGRGSCGLGCSPESVQERRMAHLLERLEMSHQRVSLGLGL